MSLCQILIPRWANIYPFMMSRRGIQAAVVSFQRIGGYAYNAFQQVCNQLLSFKTFTILNFCPSAQKSEP